MLNKSCLFSFLCIVSLCSVDSLFASEQSCDTLRNYTVGKGYKFYDAPDIAAQAARFDLPAPGYIRTIQILLGGENKRGTALLHIYGHEGSASVPVIERDLFPPIKLKKQRSGTELIEVHLPEPLHISQHQVYIVVDNLDPGVILLSDFSNRKPACESDGEKYYYQCIKKLDGSWSYAPYSYGISLIMQFPQSESPANFKDITVNVGIKDSLSSRSIASTDFDSDGFIDLLITGRLYRNTNGSNFIDVTEQVGLKGIPQGNAFVDINNDGKVDILFFSINNNSNDSRLFLNTDGSTFIEKEITLPSISNITNFAIADVNNDNLPDIFIGQYGVGETSKLDNYLLLNNGNLGFADVSGLLHSSETAVAFCSGAMWVDYDNDGDQDLFSLDAERGNLWRNDKNATSGFHIELASLQGELKNYEMIGGDWGDYNNDGNVDLLISHNHPTNSPSDISSTPSSIYQRQNSTDLVASAHLHALQSFEHNIGSSLWADLNNDGLRDVISASQCKCRPVGIYIQKSENEFIYSSFEYGLFHQSLGGDITLLDFNNDGRIDIASGHDGYFRLYANTLASSNNYIELDLQGESVNRNAIGAKVEVFTDKGSFRQDVTSGRGILTQNPFRLHFGLGRETSIDSVRVIWPGQSDTSNFVGLEVNKIHKLAQGAHKYEQSLPVLTLSPNPFVHEVRMEYTLELSAHIVLEVYTSYGQKVATVVDENQQQGRQRVVWKPQDEQGTALATGVYLYRFTVNGIPQVGNMTLVK